MDAMSVEVITTPADQFYRVIFQDIQETDSHTAPRSTPHYSLSPHTTSQLPLETPNSIHYNRLAPLLAPITTPYNRFKHPSCLTPPAPSSFVPMSQVMNGCSDLMGAVFGVEVGRHARSAVGVNVLPFGVCVEIEAIVEVAP